MNLTYTLTTSFEGRSHTRTIEVSCDSPEEAAKIGRLLHVSLQYALDAWQGKKRPTPAAEVFQEAGFGSEATP